MTSAAFAPFLFTALAMELTPGPNMAYLTLLSAQNGRRAGFACVLGIALGLSVIGALTLLGISSLVASHPLLYEAIRWAGVLFLLWLAYDTWRESHRPAEAIALNALTRDSFLRGLITNLLNPKAFIFFVAAIPTFVQPDGSYLPQASLLTLVYVAIATLIHCAIVLGAGSVSRILGAPSRRQAVGRFFAVLLVGVAIWIALTSARAAA